MSLHLRIDAQRHTAIVAMGRPSAFEVLVTGIAVDDVTGAGPRTGLEIGTPREGVFTKALDSGRFCLAGQRDRVLPQATTHSFSLTIAAAGYAPHTLSVTVPAAAMLPVALAPVRLRPLPVRVHGRVVQSSTNRSPAPGALVRVADVGNPGRLSLRTPLHAGHAAMAPVQARDSAQLGPVRKLTRDAARGADVLSLGGPAVTGTPVLGLDPQRRLEFVLVATAGPAAGEVTLTQPLARDYLRDTEVGEFAFTVPAPAPPVRRLAEAARAGDGLLFLDGPVAPAAIAVQVGDAAAGPIELHAVGAVADTEGYYALDGVGGTGTISVVARAATAAGAGPPVAWTLDYGARSNPVNLQLTP